MCAVGQTGRVLVYERAHNGWLPWDGFRYASPVPLGRNGPMEDRPMPGAWVVDTRRPVPETGCPKPETRALLPS